MDQQPPAIQNSPAAPAATPPPLNAPGAPTSSPPAATLPGVPGTWPGAFGIYKYSRQAVMLNLATLIVLWLITAVLSFAFELKLGALGQLMAFVVDSFTSVGFALVYIAGVRGQRLSPGDALSRSWPLLLKMIGLNLLVTISLLVSFLLLVIPFFFVLPRVSLANYFLVDKKLGILGSYKASWAATQGHATKIWAIIGVNILMAMLVVTIIGIPVALYLIIMYSAANVVLYEFLNKSQPQTAAAPVNMPASGPTTSAGFTPPPAV